MSGEGLKISSFDELKSLLGRAYWLESQLELVIQWEAYMVFKKDEFREALFQISHDSENHKLILNKIFSKIEGLNPDEALEYVQLKGKEFNFNGKWDEEIVTELLKHENLALDIYTKLHDFSDTNYIKQIWKDDNSDNYFKKLEFLISEEKKHVALLTPLAGKLERVI
ncbi:MAG: hypothetical protein JXA91_07570 [Candidatus Thermoplasmatota archaeon]|nr:hypothetical protein [Candidatus Thermoplasmatota archaeon]